jgi:oligopeptide transport system ATP-binding protein
MAERSATSPAPAGGATNAEEVEPLVSVRGLKKHYPIRSSLLRLQVGQVRAVDGISFDIHRGETLGMVGESGSGKSTAGRAVLRLELPTEGSVAFDGVDMGELSDGELRRLRPRAQMVFQNPHSSLNPRMTVASIIAEPLVEHLDLNRSQREDRVAELLTQVGLDPSHANRYPHEFSGGQRQRIGIARAIALTPEFIVADEPIAALDVSIQAQVVNLLQQLQDELGLSFLFISHDMSMVRHIADRVAVMYLGRIVELADVEQLFDDPKHPYTRALQSAVPVPDPVVEATRQRIVLQGDIPSPSKPPTGCPFHTRCPAARDECSVVVPESRELSPGHWVACHFAHEPNW